MSPPTNINSPEANALQPSNLLFIHLWKEEEMNLVSLIEELKLDMGYNIQVGSTYSDEVTIFTNLHSFLTHVNLQCYFDSYQIWQSMK